MADDIEAYGAYLAETKHSSQNTISSYLRDLHQFRDYVQDTLEADLRLQEGGRIRLERHAWPLPCRIVELHPAAGYDLMEDAIILVGDDAYAYASGLQARKEILHPRIEPRMHGRMVPVIAFHQLEHQLFLAFLLYFLCYLVMALLPPGEERRERLSLLSRGIDGEGTDIRSLLKEGELFSGLMTMALALIALFVPFFWRIAPSFLRLCQFPFRWWGLFWMGFLLFLLPLFRLGRSKEASTPIALGLSIFFLVLQMATVDKRIWAVEKGNGHNGEPTASSVSEIDHFGHQNEYFPQIIYDIVEGREESEYPASLVHTLGRDIVREEEPPFGIEEYVSPVFLEGEGEIAILSLSTPEADFSLLVREDSLVQFPQIYYDGYEGTLVGKDGERLSASVLSVDGFLALEVPEGEWTLELRYPGPLSRRILEPFAWVSLAILLVGTPAASYLENKKKGAPEGSPQD